MRILMTSLFLFFFNYNTPVLETGDMIRTEEDIAAMNYELNRENILKIMEYYGLSNTDIVMAQARLETGNFTSRICKEYNNLFGLYDCSENDYYKFTSWKECILFYKIKIQSRYKGGDYMKFLEDISYAEDKEYVDKLKLII